jgi:hypothetical protein
LTSFCCDRSWKELNCDTHVRTDVDTVAQAVEVEESQKQQQLAQQPATAGAPKEKSDKKKDRSKGKKPAKLAGIADLNKDNSGKLRCESTVVVRRW